MVFSTPKKWPVTSGKQQIGNVTNLGHFKTLFSSLKWHIWSNQHPHIRDQIWDYCRRGPCLINLALILTYPIIQGFPLFSGPWIAETVNTKIAKNEGCLYCSRDYRPTRKYKDRLILLKKRHTQTHVYLYLIFLIESSKTNNWSFFASSERFSDHF